MTQQYGCQTCRRPLTVWRKSNNESVYFHPGGITADHEPVPVPQEQLPSLNKVCDFCSSPAVVAEFTFNTLEMLVMGDDEGIEPIGRHKDLGGTWTACATCAALVEVRDVAAITTRAITNGRQRGIDHDPQMLAHLHRALFAATPLTPPRRPLRGTAAAQPTTVPDVRSIRPQALPKVRDRLVRFWRNAGGAFVLDVLTTGSGYSIPGHMIPGAPLHASAVHTANPTLINQYTALMGNHVENGKLFWVDSEFTALAAHAARDLPDVRVLPAELPAPDGLLVWQDPIVWLTDHETGNTMPVTAASWGPIPGGVWTVFYTPAETVLTETGQITEQRLQHLRERIGWLAPVHTGTGLVYGQNHDTDTDDTRKILTALIATWILTTQPDAEITDTPADKSTRKAYQRAKRPAPVVRLVSLRRKQQTRTEDTTTGKTRTYTRRWWVAGFFREQPYGPGRALRRRTYVRPHIKGPADAPLILTDKVNILGRRTRATDPDPRESR
ncbi:MULTISPECIES: hypothetical protein [Micromonospora]|uniref:hypothetical protein n=1 Tax=Micromonospora TaxID=1873 RepID=UPI000B291ADF|nr:MULTISPECIES: hypothetical protein [unclassified Micromonospora]MDG4756108.1 hypothetical protein [Micromonospora sp. WMMD718]MDG4756229.1 hypothetical protein [Micromonospora sp. WMMD718]